MSFNSVGVEVSSGVVVDVAADNRAHCVIGYPTADAKYTPSKWEVHTLLNAVSPLLVHAVGRGKDETYTVLSQLPPELRDQLFPQNTLETIPLAIQRYIEATHLFGPPALRVPKIGKKRVLSYNSLVTKVGLNDFSNALVKMELEFTFRGGYVGSTEPVPFIQTNYFCVPANPQMASLRALLDDRLYKYRNSLNIDGHKQVLPLFEPASYRPRRAPPLRCRRRGTSKPLAALYARHNTSVLTLLVDLKQAQKAEGPTAIETLEETRRAQISRLRFWLSLTGDSIPPNIESSNTSPTPWQEIPQAITKPTMDDLRMSRHEQNEITQSQAAMEWNKHSNDKQHTASMTDVLPAMFLNFEPWVLGLSIESGPVILARYMRVGAASDAQLRERREAANEAGCDLRVTDRMLATARARTARCDRDIAAQARLLDKATEVDEWLRDKYTGEQLYAWMDNQYGLIFQRAYADSARHGILSAENMWLDLNRTEMAYHNSKSHDFEVVKKISLRQVDPWPLMALREIGHARFSLPEPLQPPNSLYVPDHPMRRRAYTSLNCMLRLCQHRYRISPDSIPSYDENQISDLRFHMDNIPIKSIAIGSSSSSSSSSVTANASSSFTLDFAAGAYSPFEGAGVISTWLIDLPPKLRQFDYRNISGSFRSCGYASQSGVQAGHPGSLHIPRMCSLLPFWTQSLGVTVNKIVANVTPAQLDAASSEFAKMTITGYPSLTWEQAKSFADDGSADDCLVLEAKGVDKARRQDWTLSLPNNGVANLTIKAVWFLIYYYAE
ncbi:hypothetical protein F5Y16DRAFT_394170 [Xylariaceae sp. FL0255]|nr:hypothetical protein F5Y16DRAFT_394170 [Xylariaceae sp. FL0255]